MLISTNFLSLVVGLSLSHFVFKTLPPAPTLTQAITPTAPVPTSTQSYVIDLLPGWYYEGTILSNYKHSEIQQNNLVDGQKITKCDFTNFDHDRYESLIFQQTKTSDPKITENTGYL